MIAMDLGGVPLFAMLRNRLGYLGERQRVIAENVSNSDTPGYTPTDLKPFTLDVKAPAALEMAKVPVTTQPGHMLPPGARSKTYRTIKTRDSETTLDGNAVVLEEEMMKMSDARMNYDAAIGFYQKSLNLLRLATKAPGR
jgi:flagellar basal-body rod protein FlgB